MRTRCARFLTPATAAFLLASSTFAGWAATPFPSLYWKTDKRIRKVKAVFTSPIEPALAFLVAEDGLHRTADDGTNWSLVPGTGPKKMGEISCLTVCPARPGFVVLGTKGRGVFLSHDGGKHWKPGGGIRSGLACPSVHSLTFPVDDRGWDTLFACHDTAATGLSVSIDGGNTWRVTNRSRFFRSIVSCGRVMAASSATEAHPDDWALLRSDNHGEAWQSIRRSVIPTSGARNRQRHSRLLWACRSGELLCSFNWGERYFQVGPEDGGKWTSVFATPGPDARVEWMWAYDPVRCGLICAPVGAMRERWKPNNRGLYVDRMIKRGANITANAIGTRFYACINGYLVVGKHVRKRNRPSIPRCEAVPPVARIDVPVRARLRRERDWIPARQRAVGGGVRGRTRSRLVKLCAEMIKATSSREYVPKISKALRDAEVQRQNRRIVVRVWTEHTKGPAAIKRVTVTPDALGLTKPVDLFDDGRHDDLKPGDGVWGGHFLYREPDLFRNRRKRDPRRSFPGNIPVPVSAEDAEGHKATWSVLIGLHFKPVPYTLWSGAQKWGRDRKEGDVKVRCTPNAAPNGKAPALVVTGKAGPWFAWRGEPEGQHNLTGFKHVTFKFKGEPGASDIGFFLVDGLATYHDDIGLLEPNFHSAAAPLLEGEYLPAMDGKFHTVRIPAAEFSRGVRFLRGYVAGFGLRASKGARGGTYTIDEVRFEH
jgi:photosystem II stability/assembly factor-like uncharacterized protein